MSVLEDKVYGGLIGAAIGDALGGPIEMWPSERISQTYGWVDDFLEYSQEREPSAHGPWSRQAGSYTDDSRMSKFFCQAMLQKGDVTDSHDLRKSYSSAFHQAEEGLAKSFWEEYYYKAMYGEAKQIFGGQPTNGAIMGIAPYGLIHPCDPQKAHDQTFEAMFIVEGYSRYSAALAAAAIAAAMIPGATVDDIIENAFSAIQKHKSRVEGPRWNESTWYQNVGLKNELLLEQALAIARRHGNVQTLKKELHDAVCQQFIADGAETLAIALSMLVASDGDYRQTVLGCVNFGRDNDSSASVGGAIAGALAGIQAIPKDWIKKVEEINPAPSFAELAQGLCQIIKQNYHRQSTVLANQSILIPNSLL